MDAFERDSVRARLKRVWQFRAFVISSIVSDFRLRIVRSKLGTMWLVLHPLMQVAIYALVLSHILSAKLPGIDNTYAYAIYLTAGMLAWTLFSEVLSRTMTMFVDNANLLKKIVFPVAVLPLIVMGTAMINALILLLAILLIFFALGHFPGIMIVWLIPLFGVTLVFALGLGGILGIMNVFVRDISQIVPLFLQALFWFTPIVYMPTIIPEAYRHYFIYNPIVPIVEGFQNVLVYNKSPELLPLMWIALIGAVLVVVATSLYKKAAPEMVDVL